MGQLNLANYSDLTIATGVAAEAGHTNLALEDISFLFPFIHPLHKLV